MFMKNKFYEFFSKKFSAGGGGGTGDGDMKKSVYDTNLDGIVDKAENLNDGTNNISLTQVKTHIEDTGIHGDNLYTNTEPTQISLGGIDIGATFENKSIKDMWDLLLYPELYPSLTNPSITFTSSETGFREVGSIISTINFSTTFNRGSINPNYGTSGFRSGLPNLYIYTGTGLFNKAITTLSDNNSISDYIVTLGVQSWTCSVSYDEGEQPLSNKGNNYDSPLPAGQTNTITRSIIGVYPVFVTNTTITDLTKISLQAHGTVITVSMVAEDGSNKQKIEIPLVWGAISEIQQYNTLSGNWDTISLNSFTVTDIIKDINGNNINYKRYTHNGSTIGARQLRFIV